MASDYDEVAASGRCSVVRRSGELVGMLVWAVESDALLLEIVAVSPTAQGTGIGSALLMQAERIARAHEKRWVRLYTNEAMTENLPYYSHRGYVETHRAVQDGFGRVFFGKNLGPGSK